MQFSTKVDINKFDDKISYSSDIIMMGSCFAEEIGANLKRRKFNVDVNPFGILYNPVSIANSLKIILNERYFNTGDLFFNQGLWNSYSHHGKFSSASQEKTIEGINARIKSGVKNISKAGFLFLTFGTSWIYELKSTRQVVSNCHKVPASKFNRSRLSVPEIVEIYSDVLDDIQQINPGIKVVFTVSPIRHWKDGAVENQVSKSALIVSINDIIEKYSGICSYFPSYEIVMDELRDYRYYAPDMIHLSEVAVNYIWEKFEKALISNEAQKLAKCVIQVEKDINHRPFNTDTPEFKRFLKRGLKKVVSLKEKHPYLTLKLEKEYFEKQLRET